MSHSIARWFIGAACTAVVGVAAHAAASQDSRTGPAIERLKAEISGAQVSINPATGAARFVRVAPTVSLDLGAPATQVSKQSAAKLGASAASFLDRHGAAFGLRAGSRDLELRRSETDELGQTHLTYAQRYGALPVFGAQLKVHFDASGRITVVNGTIIPDIDVSAAATRSDSEARSVAVAFAKRKGATARASRLLVYRDKLTSGTPGKNYLAYEVEVSNGRVRDFVYVDAHTNKPIRKISGTPDTINRRAYDGEGQPAPGPNYPDSPFWVEGDAFPTGTVEADNMILASKETYDLFKNGFGSQLIRRRRRDHGFDLQSRRQLPERIVERLLHLVLPGHHDGRRHRPRMDARVHRVHGRPDLRLAVGRAQRSLHPTSSVKSSTG